MINVSILRLYVYIFINLLKLVKVLLFRPYDSSLVLKKFNSRKNLFFKKKTRKKFLVSKRLSLALRRRIEYKIDRIKKIDRGNFFFKKHFYRTLIKNRKLIKVFFFLNEKTRQLKISKKILKNQRQFICKNSTYEYTVLNILLRSHFCLFLSDALLLIKNSFFYLNGIYLNNIDLIIVKNDCLQFKLSKSIYNYIKRSKKLLKKKTALVRYNTWKFYKQKFFKKEDQAKPKKRKTPKFIFLFYLFKLNTPKFLEVDYLSLSIFLLNKETNYNFSSYYLNKTFSYKLFSLYNYKKIN